MEKAIDEAVAIVRASIAKFDVASADLLAAHASDIILYNELPKLVNGCKYACTRNLNWR